MLESYIYYLYALPLMCTLICDHTTTHCLTLQHAAKHCNIYIHILPQSASLLVRPSGQSRVSGESERERERGRERVRGREKEEGESEVEREGGGRE